MIINFSNIGGGGSGSGSTVSWNQQLSAGTQIAKITIDGVQQSVYAPAGGGSGTVDTEMSSASTNAVQNKVIKEYVDNATLKTYHLDNMTQAERAALYEELAEICSGKTKMDIPVPEFGNYRILKNVTDGESQGEVECFVLYWELTANRIKFGATKPQRYETGRFINIVFFLYSSGEISSLSQTRINPTYTAGSGISIENNVINCTVTGGGECNYHIVDSLSEITNPVEGAKAWVNSANTTYTSVTGYTFDFSNVTGSSDFNDFVYRFKFNSEDKFGTFAEIKYTDGAMSYLEIGTDWWDKCNTGGTWEYKSRSGVDLYQKRTGSALTVVVITSSAYTVEVCDNDTARQVVTGTTNVTLPVKGASYTYTNGTWYRDKYVLNELNFMERKALADIIISSGTVADMRAFMAHSEWALSDWSEGSILNLSCFIREGNSSRFYALPFGEHYLQIGFNLNGCIGNYDSLTYQANFSPSTVKVCLQDYIATQDITDGEGTVVAHSGDTLVSAGTIVDGNFYTPLSYEASGFFKSKPVLQGVIGSNAYWDGSKVAVSYDNKNCYTEPSMSKDDSETEYVTAIINYLGTEKTGKWQLDWDTQTWTTLRWANITW